MRRSVLLAMRNMRRQHREQLRNLRERHNTSRREAANRHRARLASLRTAGVEARELARIRYQGTRAQLEEKIAQEESQLAIRHEQEMTAFLGTQGLATA